MKKSAAIILSLFLVLFFTGCGRQQGATFSGSFGFDENDLTGQLKAEVKNVEGGYLFVKTTLEEPLTLLANVDVTQFSAWDSNNFQFVITTSDEDDIVLYDYQRDGKSCRYMQTIEIPAGDVEVKFVGNCKSIAADISLA